MGFRDSHDDEADQVEDALRARASLAGDAAGGEQPLGPQFGNAYRVGELRDYGDDLAEDDELIDDGVLQDDSDDPDDADNRL